MKTQENPITLPIVHMNGTSANSLRKGYDNAGEKMEDFIEAWGAIEFNMRDYYVKGPEHCEAARNERERMSAMIREVSDYILTHREHLYNS